MVASAAAWRSSQTAPRRCRPDPRGDGLADGQLRAEAASPPPRGDRSSNRVLLAEHGIAMRTAPQPAVQPRTRQVGAVSEPSAGSQRSPARSTQCPRTAPRVPNPSRRPLSPPQSIEPHCRVAMRRTAACSFNATQCTQCRETTINAVCVRGTAGDRSLRTRRPPSAPLCPATPVASTPAGGVHIGPRPGSTSSRTVPTGKARQKIQWAEVLLETERRKNRFRTRDFPRR